MSNLSPVRKREKGQTEFGLALNAGGPAARLGPRSTECHILQHVQQFHTWQHSAMFGGMHKHGDAHKFQSAKTIMTSLPALSFRQLRRKAFFAKWSAVDWSEQNVELAAETGLSRERIR